MIIKKLIGIECTALLIEASAIEVEVQGMHWANEQCLIYYESVTYSEKEFINKADKLRDIAKKIRALK